jgi:hypothetical protein
MRALLSSAGFALSVLAAVVITCVFAFVLGATGEMVLTLLGLGLITAIVESVMRAQAGGQQ